MLEIFFRGKMAAVVYEASATIKIIEKKCLKEKKYALENLSVIFHFNLTDNVQSGIIVLKKKTTWP